MISAEPEGGVDDRIERHRPGVEAAALGGAGRSSRVADLVHPWTAHKAGNGSLYYYNEETRQSTWTRPGNGGQRRSAQRAPKPKGGQDLCILQAHVRALAERVQDLEQERCKQASLIQQIATESGADRTAVRALQQTVGDFPLRAALLDELACAREQHSKFSSDYAEFQSSFEQLGELDRRCEHSLAAQQAAMREFGDLKFALQHDCEQQAADLAAMRGYLHEEVSWSRSTLKQLQTDLNVALEKPQLELRAAVLDSRRALAEGLRTENAHSKPLAQQLRSELFERLEDGAAAWHNSLETTREELANSVAAVVQQQQKATALQTEAAAELQTDLHSQLAELEMQLTEKNLLLQGQLDEEHAAREVAIREMIDRHKASQDSAEEHLDDVEASLRGATSELENRIQCRLADARQQADAEQVSLRAAIVQLQDQTTSRIDVVCEDTTHQFGELKNVLSTSIQNNVA
eukprot:COSAG05_NODE_3416_length_2078_cov_10.850935_1_plen_462_part_10